jgi:HAD superfamily hydrolase (TIGR01509 family)
MSNSQTSRILLGLEQDTQQSLEVSDRKEALYRQMLRGRMTMNPNLASVLESLKQAGVKMVIASSAPPENLEVVLAELGIAPYFQAIVSGDSMPSKPDPAVFLAAANLIGSTPENCIVVEDSPHGIEGARRAGMKCIAVANTQPVEKLAGANRIIEKIDDLQVEDFLRLV